MKKIVLLFLSISFHFAHTQSLTSSLTACYALDGNASEPVHNLTGTLNAVTPTANRFNTPNSACYFSGSTSSYIQLPNDSLLKPNAITVSCWIKPSSSPGENIIFTKNTSSSYFTSYSLNLLNHGPGLRFSVYRQNGSTSDYVDCTTLIVANTWYHVAFSIDQTTMKIYLNGVLEGTLNVTISNFNYDPTRFVIVGGTNEIAYNVPFQGSVNNLRFYKRVLTASEVSQLYTTDPACAATPTVAPMPSTAASFIAPDTVCVNQAFNIQNTSTGNISSYYWSTCGNTLTTGPSASTFSTPQVSAPYFFSINKDGSNYYIITSNLGRLAYGSSLLNIPVSTSLNYTFNLPSPSEGIWIEKEGSNWYGLVVGGSGGGMLTRLDFGNSLGNMPTGTSLGNIGNLDFPHRLHIFRTGGNVYGFTINRNTSTITRFDFGNSMTNTPTAINMGNIGNLNNPVDFSIINSGGNWYAYVANDDGNGTFTRLNFGNSLLNIPTGINIGSIPGIISPRALSVSVDCNGISGYLSNGISNTFYTLNFPSGPTGTIVANSLGNMATFNFPHSLQKYRVGDMMSLFVGNIYNNVLSRIDYPTCATLPSSTLQTPPAITFTAPGTYTLNLVCNEGLMDQSSYCKVITVGGYAPQVTGVPTTICAGSTATLSASGSLSYTWQPGNLTGATVTVNPPSSTVYTVTSINGSGCSSSSTLGIAVSQLIHVSALASPTIVCPGDPCLLTATGATSYTWLPVNTSGYLAVVFPTSTSIYTVIGSNGSCTASTSVIVYSGLQVNISSSGNLCNNSTVDLYAAPTGSSNTFSWAGPGIMGSATMPTITVNAGGVYSVTVTNTLTNCSGTATFFVISNASPLVIDILPSSTVACVPGPPINILVNLSANLSWFPSSEVTPNTGPLVSVSPSITSTYSVFATLGTCSGSAVVTISVTPTPTVVITSGNPTICAGASASLSASGATDYSWLPGTLTGSIISVSPLSSNVYTVTGANGICTSTDRATVTVLPSPNLYASTFPNTICIGQTATLTAAGAPTIAWLQGGIPPISNTAVVSPTVTSTYTAIGTNSFGCTFAATVQVNVINSPAISAVSSNTSICAGESITLTASGAASYTWMPGYQIAPAIVNSPTSSIAYTVTSGNAQCSYATVFILVNNCKNISLGITNMAEEPEELDGGFYRIKFAVTALNNSADPLSEVDLENDLSKTFPYPLTYTVTNAPSIFSHTSLFNANQLFDGRSDIHLVDPAKSVLIPGKRDTVLFTVLVDPNGFHGLLKNYTLGFAKDKNNQVASDTSNNGFIWDPDNDGDPTNNNEVTPITLHLIDLFIPAGFSPDGDGTNERFVISGLNERTIKLSVFNRWGNKVYEKNNYDNSWDGTPNAGGLSIGSGKLPEATYYYIVQFLDGKKEAKTGFLVIRH